MIRWVTVDSSVVDCPLIPDSMNVMDLTITSVPVKLCALGSALMSKESSNVEVGLEVELPKINDVGWSILVFWENLDIEI